MDIQRDVCTLEQLNVNPQGVLKEVRANHRPMIVASKGKPDVVIIPAKLMKKKYQAMQAVCELLESGV